MGLLEGFKRIVTRSSLTTSFVCHIKEGLDEEMRIAARDACEGSPFYAEHEGNRYCVLHYPSEQKATDVDRRFQWAVKRKLEQQDFNFAGVYFPEYLEDFASCVFDKPVNFYRATFRGGASFSGARFEADTDFFGAEALGEMDFANVTFGVNGAVFTRAVFRKDASFREAVFNGVAVFNEAYFMDGASFSEACFNELAWFQSSRFPAGANFFAAVFSEGVIFEYATFRLQSRWFVGAQFKYAAFEGDANFHNTILNHASFEHATFQHSADFTEATLDSTSGGETDFRRATFEGELYFREAQFEGDTNFYRANFLDAVKFIGGGQAENQEPSNVFAPDGHVSFTRARIEKPELFSFDTLRLRPSWLVGVDARKFDFTAVEWYGLPNGPAGSVNDEIERVRQKEKSRNPYVLMAQACQRLAANAEDNRAYPIANEFHYWSMEAQRKEAAGSNFAPWRLIWWYWVLSGYGERQIRAGVCLLGILVSFAALYIWKGPIGIEGYSSPAIRKTATEALVYSLGIMTRLANDIPTSASTLVTSLIVIEGVLGPLQIGLFLLALRRRFMR